MMCLACVSAIRLWRFSFWACLLSLQVLEFTVGKKTGLWYTIASDVQIVRVDKNVILKWASIFTNSLPNGAGVSDNPPVFYVFILTSDKMFQSRPQKTQRIPRRIPDPAWTAGAPCGKSPRERA